MKLRLSLLIIFITLVAQAFTMNTEAESESKNKPAALITGGAGFLGANLCRFLLEKGYKVYCMDNLQTGKYENIKAFERSSDFVFINYDVVKQWDFDFKVDEVYNLACPASPRHYQKDAVQTIKVNFMGTLNALNFAQKNNARYLQASTSEIYGDPLEHPQKESYWGNVNPVGPRSCYDEGKRIAESLCYEYYKMKKTPVKIVRIFNTYGPMMSEDDGRVISNFICQALKSEPITVYGDGSQTRSLCFVNDLLNGMYAMMQSSEDFLGPVNLGSEEEVSILDLALTIRDITHSQSELVFKVLPEDDPQKRRPDITLARKKLHWAPRMTLKEGLKPTVDYYKAAVHEVKNNLV
ncbi:MAG: SDR family oxidoreductase [Chlamydiales bacterium]|nr:SDR family oxidoreductase [Chlamydiales bacterium]